MLDGFDDNNEVIDPMEGAPTLESLRSRFNAYDDTTVRNKIWEEWEASIKTRAKPGCRYVVIQTRWHEDDLSGRLLPEDYDGQSGPVVCRDGMVWEIINLPAECYREDDPLGRNAGEMLWPEWFTTSHWDQYKTNIRTWNALYQQKPAGDEGMEFKREWFNLYDSEDVPDRLNVYMTSDHASSGTGDYNCFRIWGVDREKNVWLLDSYRAKSKLMDTFGVVSHDGRIAIKPNVKGVFSLVKRWKPKKWFPEKDSSFVANEQVIRSWMRDLGMWMVIEPQSTRMVGAVGKVGKAEPYIEMCRQGLVHLPDSDIGHVAMEEYLMFPAGRFDDQVDADGMIARVLMDVKKASAPAATEIVRPKDGYKVMQVDGGQDRAQRGFY